MQGLCQTNFISSSNNIKSNHFSKIHSKKVQLSNCFDPIITRKPILSRKHFMKKNIKLAPLDYKKESNKLWSKFDKRITPMLFRYKQAEKNTSFSPQILKYNETYEKPAKGYKHLRRFSNLIQYTDSTNEDIAVQCDLNSELSENETKINQDIYLSTAII